MYFSGVYFPCFSQFFFTQTLFTALTLLCSCIICHRSWLVGAGRWTWVCSCQGLDRCTRLEQPNQNGKTATCGGPLHLSQQALPAGLWFGAGFVLELFEGTRRWSSDPWAWGDLLQFMVHRAGLRKALKRECWGSQGWFRVVSEIPGSLRWYESMQIHADEWGVSWDFQENRCKGKVFYQQLAQEGENRGFPATGGKQLLQSYSCHFYINWSAWQLGFHLHPWECFKQFHPSIGLFS